MLGCERVSGYRGEVEPESSPVDLIASRMPAGGPISSVKRRQQDGAKDIDDPTQQLELKEASSEFRIARGGRGEMHLVENDSVFGVKDFQCGLRRCCCGGGGGGRSGFR